MTSAVPRHGGHYSARRCRQSRSICSGVVQVSDTGGQMAAIDGMWLHLAPATQRLQICSRFLHYYRGENRGGNVGAAKPGTPRGQAVSVGTPSSSPQPPLHTCQYGARGEPSPVGGARATRAATSLVRRAAYAARLNATSAVDTSAASVWPCIRSTHISVSPSGTGGEKATCHRQSSSR